MTKLTERQIRGLREILGNDETRDLLLELANTGMAMRDRTTPARSNGDPHRDEIELALERVQALQAKTAAGWKSFQQREEAICAATGRHSHAARILLAWGEKQRLHIQSGGSALDALQRYANDLDIVR